MDNFSADLLDQLPNRLLLESGLFLIPGRGALDCLKPLHQQRQLSSALIVRCNLAGSRLHAASSQNSSSSCNRFIHSGLFIDVSAIMRPVPVA